MDFAGNGIEFLEYRTLEPVRRQPICRRAKSLRENSNGCIPKRIFNVDASNAVDMLIQTVIELRSVLLKVDNVERVRNGRFHACHAEVEPLQMPIAVDVAVQDKIVHLRINLNKTTAVKFLSRINKHSIDLDCLPQISAFKPALECEAVFH